MARQRRPHFLQGFFIGIFQDMAIVITANFNNRRKHFYFELKEGLHESDAIKAFKEIHPNTEIKTIRYAEKLV